MRKVMLLLVVFCGMFLSGAAFAKTVEFTVQENDNFHALAKKYAVKNTSLIALNKDRLKYHNNPNLIYPGQKFIVEIEGDEKVASSQTNKAGKDMVPNELAMPNSVKTVVVAAAKTSNMPVVRNSAEMMSPGIYTYILLIVIAIVMFVYIVLFLSGNKNTRKVSFLQERVGMKKGMIALRFKEKMGIISAVENDIEIAVSLEKCFVGMDEDKRLHCVGDGLVASVSGTYNEIAKFIAKMYVRNVHITMTFIKEATDGCVSPLVPLTIENRNELEKSIFEEIHLQRNKS